ncbi:MAG: HD domain-containing protein [Candidatus Niyogibacteria bacterium]|nr:HD domain-containing protein [Candidatus Niyogibacteria bacterium]
MRYKINDPIHRIISFGEKEKRVLDHPFVQRLRHIKQLSFVSLVFPGAVHDRFSHSLGAMYMATILADQFFGNTQFSVLARMLSEKEKEFLSLMMRLAGLLHDVGHAPFSHAAEAHMPPLKTLAIPKNWMGDKEKNRRAKHEDYSVFLIWALSGGKDAVLSEEEAEIIASLVNKNIKIPQSWQKHFSSKINAKPLHTLVRSWISGDIDIDRMDYLLRDSYFTGVPYGNYDLSWLVKNLGVMERNGRYVTTISEGGVHAFEYYLLARYNMFTQIYFHKTVRCFEHYLVQALSHKEITYPISSDLHAFVNLRDTTFTETLLGYTQKHAHSWSARLMERRPSKRVIRIWEKKKTLEDLFGTLSRELKKKNVHPFLVWSQSKFLDYEEGVDAKKSDSASSLFNALSMTPLYIIRKQFGMRTAVNIEDYSFILKHYHQDISMGDIFILPEEYGKEKEFVIKTLRRHFTPSPSEIILEYDI